MPFILVKNTPITFILRRSRKAKRLQLAVRQGKFEIVAPPKISNAQALAFIWDHQYWLLKQSIKKKPFDDKVVQFAWPSDFLANETLPFRATRIALHIKFGAAPRTDLVANTLIVVLPWAKIPCHRLSLVIKQQVKVWYQQQAACLIQASIERFCPILGCWPQGFQLKQQKTRWGSCGISQKININWLLMLAPPGVLEYVVAHELCHLLHRNHGKRFWAKVANCLPDYKQYDKWLNQHGFCLQAI